MPASFPSQHVESEDRRERNPPYDSAAPHPALAGDRGFTASGLGGFSSGWFALGPLTWSSGANAGRTAEVAVHVRDGGVVTLTLLEAPVRPIATGDGFSVRAGCDKRIEP